MLPQAKLGIISQPLKEILNNKRKKRKTLLKNFILSSLIFSLTQIAFASTKSSLVSLKPSEQIKPEDSRPVVVVLHGQNVTTTGVDKSLEGSLKQMSGLLEAIKPLYKKVYFFHYDFSRPMADTGADFSKALALLTAQSENIHVIAHSMGGLIARQALEHVEKDFSAVRHLVTLGSPHCGLSQKTGPLLALAKSFGTLVAFLAPQYQPVLALADSLQQLIENSDSINQLNNKEKEISTHYHVIQGKISTPVKEIPISLLLASLLEEGESFDGVVPFYTKEQLTAAIPAVCTFSVLEGLNHNQMIQAQYAQKLVKYLETSCLKETEAPAKEDDLEKVLEDALDELLKDSSPKS